MSEGEPVREAHHGHIHPEEDAQVTDKDPTEIPTSELQAQWPEVTRRVALGGERLVISADCARVALVPISDVARLKELDRAQAKAAVADLRAASAQSGSAGLSDEDIAAEIAAARRTR